jgi:NADH:ubiquinone oxidoreductase subunit E
LKKVTRSTKTCCSKVPAPLDNTINLLLDIQEKRGWLPKEAMKRACRQRGIPGVDVYGVATFYSQFKLAKRGKYLLSLCRGTACHVKGSEKLLQYLYGLLGIRPGETTSDGKFTLQTVNCVGACAKAPNIMINNVVYGNLDEPKLKKLLEGLK